MTETATRQENPLLKLVLELGPLVAFFVANARGGIMTATAVFMVAVAISLVLSYVLLRKVAIMPLVSGVVVLTFGGLTLFLNDELFIKLKPTIVNALFGSILLGGLAAGRSFLKIVFDAVFDLTEEGWKKLTFRWGLFFFALAVLNEIVWRTQSTDFWVAFKVWGMMPITFAFTLAQMPLIQRHSVADEAEG
jgi:intracellular septation protein